MKYFGKHKEDLAEKWARSRLGLKEPPSVFRALFGIDEKTGDFSCVVLLTNFSPRNIDLNIVGERNWATPKGTISMFNGVFNTIFNELKAVRATALIAESNFACQKFVQHLGFTHEGSMRNAYEGDEDMQIYGFLREEYTSHNWCRS